MRWHPLGTGLISLQGCEAENGEQFGGSLLLLARGSPSPRQEFVAPIVRPEIDEADENIGQIGLGLDAVQFTGLYQRSQDRPIFGAVIMTREERILAGKGHHPFILPMSGRSWKFITAGIPILAARLSSGA